MRPARPILRPRRLRPGDRVALLTPASPSRSEDVTAGADELRMLGFEPVVKDSPRFEHGGVTYVAGPPMARAAQLRAALVDPGIAAVVATRGGYGSAQLLPYLDLAEIRRAQTLLIGYSDITALLDVTTGLAGLVSIHGPMAEGRLAKGSDGYDRDSFLRVVTEPVAYGRVATTGAVPLRPGEASGILRGGTLTQLAALVGTPWALVAGEPTILFLDDVNERPYRVDRLLWQLQAAGAFQQVTGIVFNQLPGCDEPGGGVTAFDAIRHVLCDFAGPVVAGVPSGHTPGPMLTLPFGVQVSLRADRGVELSIDQPAVE